VKWSQLMQIHNRNLLHCWASELVRVNAHSQPGRSWGCDDKRADAGCASQIFGHGLIEGIIRLDLRYFNLIGLELAGGAIG
jgi:hypothetical protein